MHVGASIHIILSCPNLSKHGYPFINRVEISKHLCNSFINCVIFINLFNIFNIKIKNNLKIKNYIDIILKNRQ